ncbi:MAG TPA: hypothetical protein VK465_14680 [Fibrobacteria bacterium]|nr:hypothetical protein [Fibrobacteria bacterium]
MRQLRYSLELPDGSHREHPAIPFAEAAQVLRSTDWKTAPDSGTSENPFLLFLDEDSSFFMIVPVDQGYHVTAKVADKWNLLGLLGGKKVFTLEFGLLGFEDALALLKLFYEDNYPALRALEKDLAWDDPGQG